MFTTIDIHLHADDTVIEVNAEQSGIVLREVGSFDPRLNLFLGEGADRNHTITTLIATLEQLRVKT